MMRFRLIITLLTLAGCATTPPTIMAPPPPPVIAPIPPGLAQILGQPESAVTALLGKPSMARTEGPARQLQFIRPPCVLDVFLYPEVGTPRVRTAAARRPDGTRMEPGTCLTLIIPVAQ